MDKQKAKALIRRLKKKGMNAELYEGYSGRGMYGETTTGVVTGDYEYVRRSKHRSDNLGYEYIIY